MSTTKRAVVAKVPATTKKRAVVVKAPVTKLKTDFVTVAKTKYGYYRYWVRAIMAEAAVMKYRFIKNSDSYDGVLAVAKEEADKARKALTAYTKQNPTTVSMWEF